MQSGQTKDQALNKEQLAAVRHDKGPLLVVAGAGTGKTKVIVERIARLLESGVKPNSILALTFTEKAANEMLDRVNELRGRYSLDVNIMTYNSFGAEILERFALDIGLPQGMRVLGETGQLVFMREHLDELELDYYAPISSPDSQLKNLSDYFSRLKQQLVTPERYQKFADKLTARNEEDKFEKARHQELAKSYRSYIELCRRDGVLDYDDQIYLSVELLTKRPNIRQKMREQYKYVLVDEYQDTNPMQSKLLELILNDEQSLMVVGDDDQSIYAWRGATLKNILQFSDDYPKSKEVTLIRNYRSTQAILDAAYNLIQNNNPERLEIINKLDKKLVSNRPIKGAKPVIRHFSSLDAELNWVAEDIQRRIKAGEKPGDMAVLARRNAIVARVHSVLELYGIEHVVAGLSNDLYQQPAVTSLIEILKSINDLSDNVALYHALGGPAFGISPALLSEASSEANREHRRLSDVLVGSDEEDVKAALEKLAEWRKSLHEKTVTTLAYTVLDESGWKQKLYEEAEEDVAVAQQVQALGQLFATFREFERIADNPSTLSYINDLPTLRSAGSDLKDDTLELHSQAVNVLSVHKAKGLEWRTVYIVDCTEGSFPMASFGTSLDLPDDFKTKSLADEHMAEERRLMYVASTRAEDDLALSYSDTHNGVTKRRPSRFLEEFGSEYVTAQQNVGDDDTAADSVLELASASASEKVNLPAKMMTDGKLALTASQVGDYLRCPQDFFYRHILNVPQPPNPAGSYGTLIHSQIQQLHESMKRGNLPPLESILESVKDQWPTEGYLSAKQKKRAHEQGEKTLRKLYKRITSGQIPTQIEMPFRVLIPDSDLILTGRVDAVFETEAGTEIRDYKTSSSVKGQDKANNRARSSTQLSLYALAWKLENGEIPARLVLDFVETGYEGSVKKQAKTLDNLEKTLSEIPEKIRNGEFEPKGNHQFCRHPIQID